MAFIEWTEGGLESLARHDAWRVSQGWDPLALDLFSAVEAYFRRYDPDQLPHYLPGRPVLLEGEAVGLRMVTVRVRSKDFKVFFRYHPTIRRFEVLRVAHPREK
ncbi:MAG: hypothetical protein M1598_01140 [Actinobacteria bacterium]|nr:hypothetical protein [Actinomycetota bacterium]